MISDTASGVRVQSTLNGERIKMTFDEDSFDHLMAILTDLYSDPEMAIIREYSTNAWDAHREAGHTRPIEVTLPSNLSSLLKIRDYGVGLTLDDIHRIYSKYGASTKRETDTQVGMLGLGCKSALTYTNSFTLVSVKNNRRITAVVTRDDEGASIMVMADDFTNEAPGTEIQIPIKNNFNIEKKAKTFFSFWKPGDVLVNGKPPLTFHELYSDVLKVNDHMFVVKDGYSRSRNEGLIVMGNVPYPVTFDDLPMSYGSKLITFVDIGAIQFTPSREAIQMTNRSKATIALIKKEFEAKLFQVIQDEISAAPNKVEALRIRSKWMELLDRSIRDFKLKYKGNEIPDTMNSGQEYFTLTSNGGWRLGSSERRNVLSTTYIPNVIVVRGYDLATFTATHKKKLRQYCENNKIPIDSDTTFVLVGERFHHWWLTDNREIPWKAVNAENHPRTVHPNSVPQKKIKGSYPGVVDGRQHREIHADDIDTKYPVLYYETGDKWWVHEITLLATQAYGKYTLINLAANRKEKFLRDFPNAKPAMDMVKDMFDKWIAGLSADQLLAMQMHNRFQTLKSFFGNFDDNRVNDPKIKDAARIMKVDVQSLNQTASTFARLGHRITLPSPNLHPFSDYPLFSERAFLDNEEHMYLYLNLVFDARAQGKKV